MVDITFLSEIVQNNFMPVFIVTSAIGIGVIFFSVLFLLSFLVKKMSGFIAIRFLSSEERSMYEKVIISYQNMIVLTTILVLLDITLLLVPKPTWLNYLEFVLAIVVAIMVGWLTSRLFENFFTAYLQATALSGKINGELLVVGRIVSNITIFLIIIFIFAQTHHINVLGVVASLGIGGLAVAFASQQILQQLLGGIVLYIDRPFVVDDYIGLPDGTFGKIETIGLRSTKIRNSGKGTLTIIPNNSLTSMSIENFSVARKVVSLVHLTFSREVFEDERALIRQVILESTSDIYGIDSRNTNVVFKTLVQEGRANITQAQIHFFILGSGEMSMDIRRQLLDVAKQSITLQLKEYGIAFDLEEKPVDIDAPISI
jgi:MscS family membrane protein